MPPLSLRRFFSCLLRFSRFLRHFATGYYFAVFFFHVAAADMMSSLIIASAIFL